MSPLGRVASCDAVIKTATNFEFLLGNRLKARNFIWGIIDGNDELVFWMENVPKDGTAVRDGGCSIG